MPLGCGIIYTISFALSYDSRWCICTDATILVMRCGIYMTYIRRGVFALLVSTELGNARAFGSWDE